MWFVFGWRKEVKPLGVVASAYCYDCRRRTQWLVAEESEWVTFSDIRVFRFLLKRRLHCTECTALLALSEAEFGQIDRSMQQHDSIDGTAIHGALVARIEAEQLAGKTPFQLKFIRDSIAAQEHYNAIIKAQNERGG